MNIHPLRPRDHEDAARVAISWLAERLGPEIGPAIAEKAHDLRGLMAQVLRQNEATKRAAEQLARHMEGLWRQAASVLNHAQTYGRAGVVGPGPRVVSALDLRS